MFLPAQITGSLGALGTIVFIVLANFDAVSTVSLRPCTWHWCP
ncbi:MAG TPA: hypothetical protein VHU91_02605 [Mycobacteriales bacterium]|nr:hypothetical protein [Mycobacteriales bacterium]